MTVGQIMIEAEMLNDEELDNLLKAIYDMKRDREDTRKEEAMKKLKEAWDAVTALGITIYDSDGYVIKNFNDFEWSY